jgi:hypothetical protein
MTKSQIIRVVLDQMYELFQIDTSEVWPDDSLLEFGLDEKSISRISRSSLQKLGHSVTAKDLEEGPVPKTAREVVEFVYHRASLAKHSRTSDAA